jgi:hypothetical protein
MVAMPCNAIIRPFYSTWFFLSGVAFRPSTTVPEGIMNVDLRPSTRRMIEKSPAASEAWSFVEWLRTERYTDYTIDCHTAQTPK